ncbi:MAG: acyltransferase family protein [Acidimicrobiia bacterium]|nr:acyltransferase family protein [Acidimicrobiia bacterium]
MPALDGIRGLLVMAIFFFHVGYPWASGGFLAVSVFFTLSGFLITRVLLDRCLANGTVDLGQFYSGRLRRLLPAGLLCIAFILVLSATALGSVPDTVRGDALATLGYFANWHFLFTGHSYAQLFEAPSPFLHFWSLAIEEQFYFVFPLLVLFVGHATRRRQRVRSNLRVTLLVGVGISLAATFVAATAGNYDFVYYSTISRAGELLIGGVVATSISVGRLVNAPPRRWATALGVGALACIAALFSNTSPTSTWINYGGLTAFSLASVALIISVLPRGPLASLLAFEPLRQLGRVSYGAYLFHWPIILWLTPERTGLDGIGLVLVQAGMTLALAVASFVLIEQPIRRGRVLRPRQARIMAPLAVAGLAVAALTVTALMPHPATAIDFEAAQRQLEQRGVRAPSPQPAADTPPRVGFFGDSTALIQTLGMGNWARSSGDVTLVGGEAALGCGLLRGGTVRNPFDGRITPSRSDCGDWADGWTRSIDTEQPDIAVIEVGIFDVADHQFPGDATWRAPGDPVFDAHVEAEMLAALDLFTARGVNVVWLTVPRSDFNVGGPNVAAPDNADARVARFNEILRSVARQRPDLAIVDLAEWLSRQPGGELDPSLRPDGTHFSLEGAERVAPWLGFAILRAAGAR